MKTDLRSDTITKPTDKMKEAMFNAELGDDVFGDDPTTNELQYRVAEFFGAEDALFCPSGTMTNQLAIRVHTRPGDEVICHEHSHIYNFEGGGIALNSGASVRLSRGERGQISASEVVNLVRDPTDPHFPATKLLAIENTANKGGGTCYRIKEIEALEHEARKYNLRFHLDGARLWNAIVAKDDDAKFYGKVFDTISVCLSKGLGCPVGSLLIGKKLYIDHARRMRKSMGGGMRQSGILAAAGIYALENHVERLVVDHTHAQQIQNILKACSWVESVSDVETNIVIFRTKQYINDEELLLALKEIGVLMVPMGDGILRAVTHLEINSDHIQHLENVLPTIFKNH